MEQPKFYHAFEAPKPEPIGDHEQFTVYFPAAVVATTEELAAISAAWGASKKSKVTNGRLVFPYSGALHRGNVYFAGGRTNPVPWESEIHYTQLDCHGLLSGTMGRQVSYYYAPLANYYKNWNSLEALMEFLPKWFKYANKFGFPIQYVGIYKLDNSYYLVSAVQTKLVTEPRHAMAAFYWHRYLYEYNQATTARLMFKLFEEGVSFVLACAIAHFMTRPGPNHHTFLAASNYALFLPHLKKGSLNLSSNGIQGVLANSLSLPVALATRDIVSSMEIITKRNSLYETNRAILRKKRLQINRLLRAGDIAEVTNCYLQFATDADHLSKMATETIPTMLPRSLNKKLQHDAEIIHRWFRS